MNFLTEACKVNLIDGESVSAALHCYNPINSTPCDYHSVYRCYLEVGVLVQHRFRIMMMIFVSCAMYPCAV